MQNGNGKTFVCAFFDNELALNLNNIASQECVLLIQQYNT